MIPFRVQSVYCHYYDERDTHYQISILVYLPFATCIIPSLCSTFK